MLARLVEKSWLLSREVCDANGRFEVFPDGNFGVGVLLTTTQCKLIVGGPITKRFLAAIGDDEIYWLRFRPGKMPRIADISPRDLVDDPGVVLDRFPGVDLDQLGEALCRAGGVDSRLRVLGSFFRATASAPLCQDRRCREILEVVDALDGCISVSGLSRELGLSVRMIQRVMMDQVGLTPKQILENVRLQRAIHKLADRPRDMSYGELASECGYSDQSHFIRDFKKLTHRLPSTF